MDYQKELNWLSDIFPGRTLKDISSTRDCQPYLYFLNSSYPDYVDRKIIHIGPDLQDSKCWENWKALKLTLEKIGVDLPSYLNLNEANSWDKKDYISFLKWFYQFSLSPEEFINSDVILDYLSSSEDSLSSEALIVQ